MSGIIGKIFGSLVTGGAAGAATTIGEGLSGIGDAAIKIRSAVTGKISAQEEAEIVKHLMELETNAANLQNEVNKIEAAHGSLFVAGWRPAVGWVCAMALFMYYVPRTFMATVMWSMQAYSSWTLPPFPDMGITDLLTLLLGMLGLGITRTYEKVKNVERKW